MNIMKKKWELSTCHGGGSEVSTHHIRKKNIGV